MKFTKEEKEKIKEIMPCKPPLQRITALAEYLLLYSEEHQLHELVDSHNKNAYREVIILASVQIETFLKGVLVHKKVIKDDDEETGFSEAINLCYVKGFIPKDRAINFHNCRSIRNQCAHELFTHVGKTRNELMEPEKNTRNLSLNDYFAKPTHHNIFKQI
ncbi:hypothetical protein HYX09_05230 [Candidatus Woesearchaeota archaeon]|nr:hypothetical protein [Candidatus Woesearchaeota archaeon]